MSTHFPPTKPATDIAAILFDLDGVLVDATEWHFAALNQALNLFGFVVTRYEHLAGYNGLPTRTKLDMLSLEKGFPRYLHRLVNKLKQQYTQDEILRNCWPAFDKEYMLSRLKREGYRLAVCTNSIRVSAELMLQRSGVAEYFEFVVCNEDIAKPKPDPAIYHLGMQKLGLPPERVVIVEDSPHGVEAAIGSGAHVCHVTGFEDVDYWRLRDFMAALDKKELVHA